MKSGLFGIPEVSGEVVYGLYPCLLALQQGKRDYHNLYVKWDLLKEPRSNVQKVLDLAAERGVEVHSCQEPVLSKLSNARPHQVLTPVFALSGRPRRPQYRPGE